jgi:hypothetical protein
MRVRPSPAMVVACIALFVAMGGVGYSAIKLKKNSVRTKNIKDGAVTSPKLAKTAKAPDAEKLGGISPSGYQGFCQPGAIRGSVDFDTTGLGSSYVTIAGFNCSGGPIQIKRVNIGDYWLRFAGNPARSAVASAAYCCAGADVHTENDPTIGETVFDVQLFNTSSFGGLDGVPFTLVAF